MSSDNTDIKPFTVDIDQADIDDLRERIGRTRWTSRQLPEAGWDRGVPVDAVRELAEYWATGYDWRAHEARINAYPQFTTEIDGATIHFLHVRSPEPGAFPLLLMHGWPGTFVETLDVIDALTNPRAHGGDPADAFHLVIPSMPGFAFSNPVTETGWNIPRIAAAWRELMHRLGYRRYGAAGSDGGAMIAPVLGALAPEEVPAIHVAQVFSYPSGDPTEFETFGEEEYRRLGFFQRFVNEHAGFSKIMGTRPNTLAHALSDSPVAQLSWILDPFRGFGDHSAGEDKVLNADFVLTVASLYWFTDTGGSTAHQYYEDAHAPEQQSERGTIPTGVAVFADDFPSIRQLAERDHNIVHWSEFDRGGHFSGTDAPDLLAGDLREFYRDYR
ncbi:MAG TPA: epoxide hydrolase [Pseudonocardiaceae bacterium]|jgi:pimeloyl-ACP methyl ester carboxylesterase|nr:epoxide hydrolase [Pseudonocardiaceae bacterium]